MEKFEFYNPARVVFGPGEVARVSFGPDGKLGARVPAAKDDVRAVLRFAL